MTTTLNIYGGDVIESVDGRMGRVVVSHYSLVGKETVYGIMRDGDATKPDMFNEADSERRIFESEVSRIVSYGKHDYRVGPQRGHCKRCGIAKKDH